MATAPPQIIELHSALSSGSESRTPVRCELMIAKAAIITTCDRRAKASRAVQPWRAELHQFCPPGHHIGRAKVQGGGRVDLPAASI